MGTLVWCTRHARFVLRGVGRHVWRARGVKFIINFTKYQQITGSVFGTLNYEDKIVGVGLASFVTSVHKLHNRLGNRIGTKHCIAIIYKTPLGGAIHNVFDVLASCIQNIHVTASSMHSARAYCVHYLHCMWPIARAC